MGLVYDKSRDNIAQGEKSLLQKSLDTLHNRKYHGKRYIVILFILAHYKP
jgi:hypothetical protein